jgi:hypothetical protein
MIPSISCALTSTFFAFKGNKSDEDDDDFSVDSGDDDDDTFSDAEDDNEPCGIPFV